MMLRMTLLSSFALVALVACGDDTGGGTGGDGSTSATGTTTTGATTATTGGDGGSGAGTGDGGAGAGTAEGGGGSTASGEGGGTAYDCASYCDTVIEACTDLNTQYPSVESCLAACPALDLGEFEDTGNTLGCRAYHAGAALADPAVHCIHAGPLGVGACSADDTSPCEAFCAIADEVCPGTYASAGACEKVCADFALGEYNADGAEAPADDSLACRMYHLTVAASSEANNPIHCPHIVVDSPTCG